MEQEANQPVTPQRPRKPNLTFNRVSIGLIIGCSVAAGLLVNFLDNVHYNNLLLQAYSQASTAQSELGKEQYDVKFLINNGSKQLNCYDLRSDYARTLCSAHDQSSQF